MLLTETAYILIVQIATALAPIGGAAAAVVAVTIGVRLLLHPLTRAAVRGEKAKSRLAPRVAELRRRHGADLPAMSRELSVLYRDARISPFAGLLPMLVQVPLFIILFQLFASSTIDGHGNALLGEQLFGVPLSARFVPQLTSLGAEGWVFLILFAVLSLLAWLASRRMAMLAELQAAPPTGLLVKLAQVAPYAALISAAFLPLAAGMFLATTTAWTTVENLLLKRGIPETGTL